MSITSANAIFTLTVANLYTTPVQLQGFAADDIVDTDPLDSAEVMMGVDGKLSGGFVYVPVKQSISLQADSASIIVFETWYLNQQLVQDVYTANGVITLPSTGRKYTLTNGFLTSYASIPDAKKVLQPRKFAITWQSIVAANTSN